MWFVVAGSGSDAFAIEEVADSFEYKYGTMPSHSRQKWTHSTNPLTIIKKASNNCNHRIFRIYKITVNKTLYFWLFWKNKFYCLRANIGIKILARTDRMIEAFIHSFELIPVSVRTGTHVRTYDTYRPLRKR